jgi:hypothetical protein
MIKLIPAAKKGRAPFSVGIRGEGRVVDPHLLDGGGGKRSMDDGNVDTGLFEYSVRLLQPRRVRYGKCARYTSTALLPCPAIASEFWSRGFEFLETGYDPVLKADDIFCDLIAENLWHFVESKI